MNIYDIFNTKEIISPRYLNRYIDFITACMNTNNKIIVERHHICPKSIFPEYADLAINTWNRVDLTPREHFIAHWMLHKAVGESQTFAFFAMCNQTLNRNTKRNYRINSRFYQSAKLAIQTNPHPNIGKAAYKDINGKLVYTTTDDKRIITGELTSLSKGRKYKSRTLEQRNRTRLSNFNRHNKQDTRTIKIYKDDQKKVVKFYSELNDFLLAGWTTKQTKAYRSRITTENNKTRVLNKTRK